MCFEQYSHEPFIATSRFWIQHLPMTQERRRALQEKREPGVAALRVMEGHLATRAWFVADAYTLADVALYAYTHVADEGGFDLAPFPAVRAWIERVGAEPGHVPITHDFATATGGRR